MATEPPRPRPIRLATVTVVAVGGVLLLFSGTFPPPRGHDAGGPPFLLFLSIPISAVGGLLLGAELSKFDTRLRHRPVVAAIQLLGIALIVTPAIAYLWLVAPDFFDLGVIRSYYGVPIAVGVVLVVFWHGIGLTRDVVQTDA